MQASHRPARRSTSIECAILILRYAINTKGKRNLTGADVKFGRVALLFGEIPNRSRLVGGPERGAAKSRLPSPLLPTPGSRPRQRAASFDDLEMAPPMDDYDPTEFTFENGMILFNRVVGSRPEEARYAKLLVEDITETRPQISKSSIRAEIIRPHRQPGCHGILKETITEA